MTTRPADIDDQDVIAAAWKVAKESPINVLSDMELLGARATPEGVVVGAWFGGSRTLMVSIEGTYVHRAFSFDIVVDPAHQRKGIGSALFQDALTCATDNGDECVELTVCSEASAKMAARHAFKNIGGSIWFRWINQPTPVPTP